MPLLPYGPYNPDQNDLDSEGTRALSNVLPRADGYGPIKDLTAWSMALAAECRGMFFAKKDDGSVAIFAGTATKLYLLNNTYLSWADVSKGGSTYTTLNTNEHWSFAQFGSLVIAVQANAAPQVYNLSSSSAFDDLAGSPPQARYVTTVNEFVVLYGLNTNIYRVHWSGLGDATNWTAGTGSSDYQDLSDGGVPRAIVGGEFGFILQETAIRRMTFSPGSDAVFQIERVIQNVGVLSPYAVANTGSTVFFWSSQGLYRLTRDGALTPIGEERVNRTFLDGYDTAAGQYFLGVADPSRNIVLFTYRARGSSGSYFDRALVYNYALDRFSPISITGTYVVNIAQPGLTLEALDAIAPGAQAVTGAANNGAGLIRLTVGSTSGWTTGDYKTISGVGGVSASDGTWVITVINGTTIDLQGSTFSGTYTSGGVVGGSLDLLATSLDGYAAASLPYLSVVMTDHKIGFLTGSNVEATLETPEQSLDGQRILVNGFYPVTDAPTVYGCVSKRENLNASITYTNESTMNARGFVPQLRSTRYSRAKVRIPAGTSWTYATGVRPEIQADGEI